MIQLSELPHLTIDDIAMAYDAFEALDDADRRLDKVRSRK